jgi:hypothetical protein
MGPPLMLNLSECCISFINEWDGSDASGHCGLV